MRAEHRDMSLFRFAQVFRGIANVRTLFSTLGFSNTLMRNEEEPKHVLSLLRLLNKIVEYPNASGKTAEARREIFKVLNDNMQVDLNGENLTTRIHLLDSL